MNKKGFTIIEILAVVIILGVIMTITYPTVVDTFSNVEDRQYEALVSSISSSAKSYVTDNRANISSLGVVNGVSYISLSTLRDEGYLASDIYDPKTQQLIDYSTRVKIITKVIGKKEDYIYPGD